VPQNPLLSPNTRTPALDLDSVFGGGPGLRPDLYVGNPDGSVARARSRAAGWGGWGGCWGCWWGPTLGLGLYFSTLPLYYSTYWWDGVPYYYADNNYYIYDPNAGQYQTVAPPEGLASQVQPGVQQGGAAPSGDLAVYPKNGQSDDQTSKDKFECHQWAASQSGYDPTQGTSANPSKRSDYMRAEAACLTGRGYSVM